MYSCIYRYLRRPISPGLVSRALPSLLLPGQLNQSNSTLQVEPAVEARRSFSGGLNVGLGRDVELCRRLFGLDVRVGVGGIRGLVVVVLVGFDAGSALYQVEPVLVGFFDDLRGKGRVLIVVANDGNRTIAAGDFVRL